ncbi:MAG TPA: Rieske 2Fe-2S domain-containing protein [Stellaceae bacterium]|nr:Rieske 2Fe-2S domain-containing protein [Stellaceae bacterium]
MDDLTTGKIDIDAVTRTGPGTLAGRYMRRFWQPVAMADEIETGKARTLKIMSEEFTLYRGKSGRAYAVGHRCAHRETQLSVGMVIDDCIRCLYHGWKYDGDGNCVDQPAETNQNFARKVHIRSYPVVEYIGLVFVYMGEGEAPPPPRFAEFEGDGLLYPTTYTRLCNYYQNIENACDPTHLPFTHIKTFDALNFDVPTVAAEETAYGLIQFGTRGKDRVRAQHILMPNLFSSVLPSPEPQIKEWPLSLAWRVPVDDETHKTLQVYFHPGTPLDPRAFQERRRQRMEELAVLRPSNEIAADILANKIGLYDPDIMERPDYVNIQDHVAQMGQGAITNRARERLGVGDTAIILLRKLWLRDLAALDAGREPKQWRYPAGLDRRKGT